MLLVGSRIKSGSEFQAIGPATVFAQDPCFVTNATNYEPYERGLARDIYVKWPNSSAMPDDDFRVTNSTAMLGFVSSGTSSALSLCGHEDPVAMRVLGALRWLWGHSVFYRAMLCIRGTSHGPVSLCVCLSVSVCVCHKSEFY